MEFFKDNKKLINFIFFLNLILRKGGSSKKCIWIKILCTFFPLHTLKLDLYTACFKNIKDHSIYIKSSNALHGNIPLMKFVNYYRLWSDLELLLTLLWCFIKWNIFVSVRGRQNQLWKKVGQLGCVAFILGINSSWLDWYIIILLLLNF